MRERSVSWYNPCENGIEHPLKRDGKFTHNIQCMAMPSFWFLANLALNLQSELTKKSRPDLGG